jgi:chemosensory pili system protein ChpA (sensor histidine kinase/response regulator)
VVDDDEAVVELVCAVLDSLGAEAIGFSSSPAAAARLEAEPFDAVVTDLEMPFVDGAELVWRVRASKLNARTFVAILTGSSGTAVAEESLRAGANVLLQKPATLENMRKLLEEIRAQLSRREEPGSASRD